MHIGLTGEKVFCERRQRYGSEWHCGDGCLAYERKAFINIVVERHSVLERGEMQYGKLSVGRPKHLSNARSSMMPLLYSKRSNIGNE